MIVEQWRTIPGFSDYSISDRGAVKRTVTSKTSNAGKIRKTYILPNGYQGVVLRRDGRTISQYVHTLVLLAFIGPRPTNNHQAAHENGIRTDNRLENLRWATRSENCADKKKHGTDQRGMRHHLRRLSEDDIREIRQLRLSGITCKELAGRYGVSLPHISSISNGRSWGHIT